ncbi:MAG: serine/threonine-protein kinase [Pirellulaceae bacterium]
MTKPNQLQAETRERKIFAAALEKEAEQRAGYLELACGEDVELRSRIDDLLNSHSAAGEFLEAPLPGLALTIVAGGPEFPEDGELNFDFLDASDKPGCLGLLGQYEIVGVIGRGAFGIVLRAFDTKLNRVVAIKVMAPELAQNTMAVKRFSREAQAAAAVVHDHVVTLHAIEENSRPPFIVMEYVEGQPLSERIEEQGALEVTEILRIGMQIASGLNAAHQQGLVHRDVKPANILLENGVKRVKLTDFGLARAVDDIGMTQTGTIAGTPQYMSPEQGLGKAIDERSDLFSLGSVLYTLCTGKAPFRADSTVATLKRVCDDQPRSIVDLNPDIPKWLDKLVRKLLAKNPDKRYQSAAEVEALLRDCLADWQSGKREMPRLLNAKAITKHLAPERLRQHRLGRWLPGEEKARNFYFGALLLQLAAILVAVFASFITTHSIMVSGAIVGLVFGPALFFLALLARMPLRFAVFGLSCVCVVPFGCGFIGLFNLGPGDWFEVRSIVLFLGIPLICWGGVLVGELIGLGTKLPDVPAWNFNGFRLFILSLQVLGIGLAAALVSVEYYSILATLPFLLLVGTIASFLCLPTDRSVPTKIFAVSPPSVALLVGFSMASFAAGPPNSAVAEFRAWGVAFVIISYAAVAVPFGLWVVARESNLFGDLQLHRFSIRNGLVITAVLALSLALARPSLGFGVPAIVANSLFGFAFFSLAGLLALWLSKRGNAKGMVWFSVCAASLLLAISFMGGMAAYDYESNYGFLVLNIEDPKRAQTATLGSVPYPLSKPLRIEVTDSAGTIQELTMQQNMQSVGPLKRGPVECRIVNGSNSYFLKASKVNLRSRREAFVVGLKQTGT